MKNMLILLLKQLVTGFTRDSPISDNYPEQNNHNRKLASARIVVERFFGRMKNKWGILKGKYRGDRSEYQNYFKIYVALTNYDIRECDNLLIQSDSFFYE